MSLSHHFPAVKPWEWVDVPPIWQDWALIHLSVSNEVAKGAQKTEQRLPGHSG